MAASISDKLRHASNGSRPEPTTLTGSKSIGAATISTAALNGWATDTSVDFVIYTTDTDGNKVAGSQTDWTGIVSGTTITSLTLRAGTDAVYPIGATVVGTPTGRHNDDIVDWGLAQHTQAGAHGAITATSLVSAGAVTGTTVTGTSVVSTGDIQQRSISLETIRGELEFDFVASGLVWSGDAYASTRNASMTSGVVYIGGRRFPISAVTARSFTASKDTYVDIDNTGALVYTEVTNNAASPALTAGSIRIAIIVTGASNIAAVGSVNQGQETKVLPIASSIPYQVTDSLGNLICPRDPQRKVLGYRQVLSDFTTTTVSSFVDVTGLSVPFLPPSNRKVEAIFHASQANMTGGSPGARTSAIFDGATQISQSVSQNSTGFANSVDTSALNTPSAGLHTYKASVQQNAAGTLTLSANSTSPIFLEVRLV